MFNKLCEKCVHHCKQDETAKIMQCPRFQKRLTDNEFKDLIVELDDMEAKAKDLKKRTQNLIRQAQGSSDAEKTEDTIDPDVDENTDPNSVHEPDDMQ